MKLLLCAGIILTSIAGCASQLGQINLSQRPLETLTHEDLKGASSYAATHGFPARAAVYDSIDAQFKMCEDAVSEILNSRLSVGTENKIPGPITLLEIGAETAGGSNPLLVKAKINCAPFPFIPLPSIPFIK